MSTTFLGRDSRYEAYLPGAEQPVTLVRQEGQGGNRSMLGGTVQAQPKPWYEREITLIWGPPTPENVRFMAEIEKARSNGTAYEALDLAHRGIFGDWLKDDAGKAKVIRALCEAALRGGEG